MYRVAIITASDSGYRGEREDLSGPLIREIVEKHGYKVSRMMILPDERSVLAAEMARIADDKLADLLLTTGGTGFSPRDCMPEATLDIVERPVPGIPEALRSYSMRYSPRSMLSRAMAGIRGRTLIINLPGSPKAVRENLEYLIETVDHGLEMLLGEGSANCAR
jgi:molybdopterin adenylyltransferase